MIKSLTLGLGLLAASAADAQVAYFLELGNGYSKPAAGSGFGTDVYFSATQKLNDQWKAGFEFLHSVSYVSKGESELGLEHGGIRIPVTRSGLNWLPGWKTSMTYRWNVPTASAGHLVGGLGSFLFRPAFTKEFTGGGVLLRPQATIALTDSYKQKYVAAGASPAANTLFSWAFEFIPYYTISEGLDISLSSSISQPFKAGINGSDAAFGTALVAYEVELGLPVKAAPFSFAVSVAEAKIPVSDFEIFSKERLGYNFYVRAEF